MQAVLRGLGDLGIFYINPLILKPPLIQNLRKRNIV